MKYILFEAGPVTVYSYGLMIALGVILTFVVAQKRAKNYGLDPDAIFYMGAWGLLAGILGAKLLFYLTEIKEIIKDPSLLLNCIRRICCTSICCAALRRDHNTFDAAKPYHFPCFIETVFRIRYRDQPTIDLQLRYVFIKIISFPISSG